MAARIVVARLWPRRLVWSGWATIVCAAVAMLMLWFSHRHPAVLVNTDGGFAADTAAAAAVCAPNTRLAAVWAMCDRHRAGARGWC